MAYLQVLNDLLQWGVIIVVLGALLANSIGNGKE
jgi:hypothetical protein